MSAWLAVLLAALVLGAAIGIVPLRRYQDRQWAEHLARQRVMASPAYRKVAANFVRFQLVLRDSFTPALQQAAAAIAKFGAALDALPKPTRRQRIAARIRGWFA